MWIDIYSDEFIVKSLLTALLENQETWYVQQDTIFSVENR